MGSNIIELIKVLRERTGAGMMDCKKALEENSLDLDKACDWLREKGIAKAAKKADRIAAEGLTFVKTCSCGSRAVLVEVNCETDFVAKGDKFHKLVEDVANIVLDEDLTTVDAAKQVSKDLFADATISMGEKLDLRRFVVLEKEPHQAFGSYIHMGGKISVLLLLSKADEGLAKELAMHIAANNPTYISKKDIPLEVIEKEKAIALEASKLDEKLKNKPAAALEKIIEGKVNKTLSETVLSEQEYLMDGSKTVGQVLLEKGVEVVKFYRYQVGEGIEKRHDDFASEVMSQVK